MQVDNQNLHTPGGLVKPNQRIDVADPVSKRGDGKPQTRAGHLSQLLILQGLTREPTRAGGQSGVSPMPSQSGVGVPHPLSPRTGTSHLATPFSQGFARVSRPWPKPGAPILHAVPSARPRRSRRSESELVLSVHAEHPHCGAINRCFSLDENTGPLEVVSPAVTPRMKQGGDLADREPASWLPPSSTGRHRASAAPAAAGWR